MYDVFICIDVVYTYIVFFISFIKGRFLCKFNASVMYMQILCKYYVNTVQILCKCYAIAMQMLCKSYAIAM